MISGDDGYRLLLNDKEIIDSWKPQSETTNKYKLRMEAGKAYKIRIEYFESIGGAVLKFGWNFQGSYDKRVVRLKEEKQKAWKKRLNDAKNYHSKNQLLKFSEPLYWKHITKTMIDPDYKDDFKFHPREF